MLVSIDGWTGVGKTTVGLLVAERINGVFVDSGRLYRALTASCVAANIPLLHPEKIARYCTERRIQVCVSREGSVVPEGVFVVDQISLAKKQLDQYGEQTSVLSRIPRVRSIVNSILRDCMRTGHFVVVGRDMGAVVFPETPFKFFLTASAEVRQKRLSQRVKEQAHKRDQNDKHNIRVAADATSISTDQLSAVQVASTILTRIQEIKKSSNATTWL